MFDLGASELLLIVIVAVLVIGPKDMPLALRTAGRWIGKVRRLSNHFRAGLDAMVREAEMEEMEKKWKAQNERIMKQDPATLPVEMEPTGALPARPKTEADAVEAEGAAAEAKAGATDLAAEAGSDPAPEAAANAASTPTPDPAPEPVEAESGEAAPPPRPGN